MSAGTRAATGNELSDTVLYLPAVPFPTLAANASATTTFSIPGLAVGDCFSWNMQAPPAHLVIDNMYTSAAGVVSILWGTDATGITGATVALLCEVVRPENAQLGLSTLPSNMT